MRTEIERLTPILLRALLPLGVRRVAIFGSFARGEETPQSDLDVLVAIKPPGKRKPIGLRWFAVERELSRAIGRRVDLVSEAALSPHVRPYVERDLQVIYEEGR